MKIEEIQIDDELDLIWENGVDREPIPVKVVRKEPKAVIVANAYGNAIRVNPRVLYPRN